MPTSYRSHTHHISTLYRPHTDHVTDHMPTSYRSHTDHISTLYRPHTDRIVTTLPITCRPHTDHIPTIYRPYTDLIPTWLPTINRPHTDHVSTLYRQYTDSIVTTLPTTYRAHTDHISTLYTDNISTSSASTPLPISGMRQKTRENSTLTHLQCKSAPPKSSEDTIPPVAQWTSTKHNNQLKNGFCETRIILKPEEGKGHTRAGKYLPDKSAQYCSHQTKLLAPLIHPNLNSNATLTKCAHENWAFTREPEAHRDNKWSVSNFFCSLTRNLTSHSMENMAYSDERWLYYQSSQPHSYISLWEGCENVLFQLGSERVWLLFQLTRGGPPRKKVPCLLTMMLSSAMAGTYSIPLQQYRNQEPQRSRR